LKKHYKKDQKNKTKTDKESCFKLKKMGLHR
jgi:hypothetical protein